MTTICQPHVNHVPRLVVHDWDKWQSFRKDRGTPPWIKIHRCVFSCAKWASLSDAEKGQIISMWIVAADKEGELPTDPRVLMKVCQLDTPPDIKKFVSLQLLDLVGCPMVDSMTPSGCQDDAPEERRGEEKRGETFRISDENAVGDFYLTKKKKKLSGKRLETFLQFWTAFNLKLGKAEAADAWLDIPSLTGKVVAEIVAGAKREADLRPQLVAAGKTPKWAQGWLTGRRWEDEAVASAPVPQEDKKCAGCGILVEFGCKGKTAESRACASYEVVK